MKTIKLYWKWLVAAIVALLSIFVVVQTKRNNKKLEKTANQIDDNNQQIDQLQGKTEIIDDTRATIKEEISKQKADITELEQQKENITVNPIKVNDAKENILNKTSRARKPKK